jgi:tight adherence protein B
MSMILLSLVFLAILIIVFGILAFTTRPTPEQNAIQRRITTIVAPRTEFEDNRQKNNALTLIEPKNFGWVDSLIGNSKFARNLKLLILQSHKNTSAGIVLGYMAALAFCTFFLVYFFTSMLLVSLAAGAITSYLPIMFLRIYRQRRVLAFNAVLPDCIETCARSLRAGHSIVAAIGIVTELAVEPAKTEFSEVFKKQNYGLPLREALMQMLERVPSSDLQVMVTGILVQKDTGGNLAEILDRTAAVIRDRIRIQGEIRTHTAQGRMTGWILFLLPVVMMLAINLVNPGYSHVLFKDPLGRKLLYAGLTLLVLGGLMIRQIVKGIEV